jgi:O-antigen ligase
MTAMRSPVLVAGRAEAGMDPQAAPSVLDSVVFYGVWALLLFGPLAFGAVEPWSIFLLEAGAALLFVVWTVRQVTSGEVRVLGNPLFVPMLLFAALIGAQLVLHRTSYRYQTVSSLLLYGAYGMLCFLVIQSLRRTSQVRILARVFCLYGFSVAAFALLEGVDPNGKLYWIRTPHLGGWIYGPYVNHNHYAGLMEMLTPIPLVAALTSAVQGPRKTFAAVAAGIMSVTIFLSGSRGGILAFAVQMAVLAAILIRRRKSRTMAVTLGIFLVLVLGLLAWLGGGQLNQRLASIRTETRTELSGGTRMDINRDALKMFELKPVLGWGLGVFPTVYPQYRSFYTNFFVNQAHDDYVQLLVEMGGLGFAIMLGFLAIVFYRAIPKTKEWWRDPNGAVALAALLGIIGILVHSFVDFNLQIPANAALFYVLCAVAAMRPRFAPFRRARVPHRSDMPRELSA